MSDGNQRNKATVAAFRAAIDAAPDGDPAAVAARVMAADAVWQGYAPLRPVTGPEAFAQDRLGPLKRALPPAERLTHILIAGRSDGRVSGGGDGRARVVGDSGLPGVRATHTGPCPGHAAPGRSLSVNGIDLMARVARREQP